MFLIYGPYAPVSHGSFFPGLDAYVRYILRVAERMATDNIRTLEIKVHSRAQFNSELAHSTNSDSL